MFYFFSLLEWRPREDEGKKKLTKKKTQKNSKKLEQNLSLARRGIVAKPTDLISLAWSTLAPTLLATGLSYVLLPGPTARLVLGAAPSRGPTLALWQLAGASIATLLVPMALNLKVAEDHDRLSAPTHAMESLALAAAAGVHVAAFARDLEHVRAVVCVVSLETKICVAGEPLAEEAVPADAGQRQHVQVGEVGDAHGRTK